MVEKNYDFRARHWQYHRPGLRNSERQAQKGEILIDESWTLGCDENAPENTLRALTDFQDYLLTSLNLSLRVIRTRQEKTLWFQRDNALDRGFVITATENAVTVSIAPRFDFPAMVYLEDVMSLEGAPVIPEGKTCRKPLYTSRQVHSGSGIDAYSDSELAATIHAGYDVVALFMTGIDRTPGGYCNVNDLIQRAAKYDIRVMIFNYVQTFVHPDEPGAQEKFDSAYGEFFKRYPGIMGLFLCGESLEFPSKDPATTGQPRSLADNHGIPDIKPSPGWYPCYDYPAYLACIEKAVHKYAPHVEIYFETYNWGYAPLDVREKFIKNVPPGIIISVTYEIFAQKTLEGLRTPVMDYTVSTDGPGYYFTSECEVAAKYNVPLQGNVNTAGIGWDFGTVPYVPVPYRWLKRNLNLRKACKDWNLNSHYATHHYGWWNSVAADLGKWSSWEDFEPDYDLLLEKIAVRDYGKTAAPDILKAWKIWGEAMEHYTASNEDQYGPWRVGPAYPFIFHPNITRTMERREITFPTAPHAHFGSGIIRTFYQPCENENQSPGFLRYPAEIRSLEKMLKLWNEGLQYARSGADSDNGKRLIALGEFIRNSIITTLNIKHWWKLNTAMVNASCAQEALVLLEKIENIAIEEIQNARNTIPVVETDSRLGWEPSMEYVCDKWHLEWKIRQVESALREISAYRNMLKFSIPNQ